MNKKLEFEKGLWEELADGVLEMDEDRVINAAGQVIRNNFSVEDAMIKGLSEGMGRAGERFAKDEYFVPEILMCADAMNAGFDVLKEYVKEENIKRDATVLIGVVEGDFHDLGKNIVSLLMQAAGFKVYDIGYNVHQEKFIEKINELKPDIVAVSTLMTTTLEKLEDLVTAIKTEFSNNTPKTMVGGAPVTQFFADKIGADFYGDTANDAVIGVKKLMGIT
ncbi:B12-binding domain-containing protein [candidate division KSB1 bacterium]